MSTNTDDNDTDKLIDMVDNLMVFFYTLKGEDADIGDLYRLIDVIKKVKSGKTKTGTYLN